MIDESNRNCQTDRRPWPRCHSQGDPPHHENPRGRTLAVGSDADVVIFDPNYEGTVHLADNPNGVDYNLYEGRRQSGRVETVLLRGQVVVENAKFVGRYGQGKFIPANMYASGYENRN